MINLNKDDISRRRFNRLRLPCSRPIPPETTAPLAFKAMRNPEPLADPPAELAAESVVLRHAAMIMWPAFMAACLLEALVFALIDPSEVHWPGQMAESSRQSVYSVAFFLFWIICMACSALVLWLAKSERSINDQMLTDRSED